MQREIKFRAWDPKNKRMISSVGFTDSDIGRIWRQEEYMMGESAIDMHNEWVPLQYTGLLDKNGVEIYERDIVKVEMKNDFRSKYIARATVVWNEPEAMWCIASPIEKDGSGFVADLGRKDEEGYVEIIGNVYEHSELLDLNNKGV